MSFTTRIRAAVVGMTVAATSVTGVTAFTAATAQPAHANQQDCQFVLAYNGYVLTNPRVRGCLEGASGRAGAWIFCHNILIDSGVVYAVTEAACEAAAD